MTDADKVHGSAVTVQVGSKHHMSVNPNFLKFLTQGSGRRLVLWYIHNISETINRRRQEQAVRELSILYSRRDELLPAARDCLFPTLAEHYSTKTTTQMANCLVEYLPFLVPKQHPSCSEVGSGWHIEYTALFHMS